MKALICIVCPKGCHLQVDEHSGFAVAGNACSRGAAYGREEASHPKRVLTSTVRVAGAGCPRCPVKLTAPIPKALIPAAMQLLHGVCLRAPVRLGQTVVANVCDTGVDFVTTRKINA